MEQGPFPITFKPFRSPEPKDRGTVPDATNPVPSQKERISLVFLMIATLICVKWDLIVVLTCIALWLIMLSIFLCTCWPSVCLPLFLLGLCGVLLLSCMSSGYILDTNPLSDIWFANIFPTL